ncbi:MAG: phosphoglycerate mutase (2,3-diphosphoglycerate-independent), partial [Candidatus Lambdaproteobacteria bacterium]|nr:phosphoglycerate mutase (2,3-diphosphoglycerate-independent) [Candidatus Lambdaproteobacteria bacterium]
EKDIGGSEVGHLTMGAGKILPQGPTRIKQEMSSGRFFKGEALNRLIDHCVQGGGVLHLLGLLSDGNVHSHISHFDAIIDYAAQRGVSRLFVHALLDGRDVPYQSALDYVQPLQARLARIEREHPGWVYGIASGGGREVITMDRDQNWEKVRRGWAVHVRGEEGEAVADPVQAILRCRQERPDCVDQDLTPFVVVRDGKPVGPMRDGDALIFMNFRGDRAIEFTRAMVEDNFAGFDRGQRPQVLFAGMMLYDEDTDMPPLRLMAPASVANPFGRRILELGLRQFRLAETQKYAHVTFFFNGGYREPLDKTLETYVLIPSDKIDSFAAAPSMKALEIGRKAVELIGDGSYDFGLINFANTDMVGHTGNLGAAIRATEAVDRALAMIVGAIERADGLLIVTADHGNAEEMISLNPKTGKREPNTRHSINPVPLILFDPRYAGAADYVLRPNTAAQPNRLSMLAATNFILLGRLPPEDLDPSLFQFS